MLLLPDAHPAYEHDQVTHTRDQSDQPDTDTMHDQIQQVLYGGDTVTLGHAVPNVHGIAAVVECVEGSGIKKK